MSELAIKEHFVLTYIYITVQHCTENEIFPKR